MGRDPDVFHARLGTSVEYDMVWFSVVIFTIWRIVENAVSSPSIVASHGYHQCSRCIWQLCRSKHQLFGSLAGAFKLGTNRCLAKDLELVATNKTLRFLFASCKILTTLGGSSESKEILLRPYLFPCFFFSENTVTSSVLWQQTPPPLTQPDS